MRSELLIGGVWRAGAGGGFSSTDPALGGTVWEGSGSNAADVADAIAAARRAFADWRLTPLESRAALARAFGKAVEARAELFATTIARETGKPLWEARTEVAAMLGKIEISIRTQAERAGARAESAAFGRTALDHRPWGVMAVFGPYNFPGHLPNGHIVPAVLAGNSVVFKPSELTPGVGALMAQAWTEAGAPNGVINLVQGSGRETGAALLAGAIDGVLFTGSVETGLHIHRTFAGRPDVVLALEMGGNNPLIVWDPVDPDAAANLIAHSAFATSGQRCSCARRLILPHGAFGDRIRDALAALAAGISVGPWNAAPAPFMGPLVRDFAAGRSVAAVNARIGAGARALTPVVHDAAFLRPMLLEVPAGADIPDAEVFAPVLHIYRADDLDDAIRLANATRFGLSGGLVCDDPDAWTRVRSELRAGVLNWNRPTTGASSALPFGGPGLSGNGRPSAAYAADYCAWPVASQEADRARSIAAEGLPATGAAA